MPHNVFRARETDRLRLFVLVFVPSVILLLAFTYLGVVAQHAAAVYSHGQLKYVQAHGDAVRRLHSYAVTGDPRQLRAVAQALAVPFAYRESRRALERGRSGRARAVAGFTSSGIDTADAERAAAFFPVFRHVTPVTRSIAAWRESDRHFDSLATFAAALQAAHARGDARAIAGLQSRIDAVDGELRVLEEDFTDGIDEASRLLPQVVLVAGVLLGMLLLTASLGTLYYVARSADAARASQLDYMQKLHLLMEEAPDTITWFDRDLRYVRVNAALERLTGLGRDQLIGREVADIEGPAHPSAEGIEQMTSALRRTFAGESDVSTMLEIRAADGSSRYRQLRFAGQRGDDGQVETVVSMGRDVTALHQSQAALRERDAQLRHSQKLEAVGRLAGGVAHEFNNILAAITGNLELALMDLPPQEPARRDLDAALGAARRAAGLTRQLLTLGRRDAVEVRPVQLDRLIAELQPVFDRLAGDRVQVAFVNGATGATAMVDPGHVQQVLLNLITNARDAMPEGGVVQIELAFAANDDMARRRGRVGTQAADGCPRSPSGRWITLTVRDSGAGIPPETLERMFEAFYTTKDPGAGTGLGLSVVDGIVSNFGGCIFVETARGAGTAITIALPDSGEMPAGPSEADTDRALRAAPAGGTRAGGTILLVEDEAVVRTAVRRTLARAGYTVVEAQHAADALLLWPTMRADLVVTDFMMPGLTGVELIQELRRRDPHLPALIISGYTGGDVIDVSTIGGRTQLAQKPLGASELLAMVEGLIGRS